MTIKETYMKRAAERIGDFNDFWERMEDEDAFDRFLRNVKRVLRNYKKALPKNISRKNSEEHKRRISEAMKKSYQERGKDPEWKERRNEILKNARAKKESQEGWLERQREIMAYAQEKRLGTYMTNRIQNIDLQDASKEDLDFLGRSLNAL